MRVEEESGDLHALPSSIATASPRCFLVLLGGARALHRVGLDEAGD